MWNSIVDHAQDWAPALGVAATGIVLVGLFHRTLRRRHEKASGPHLGIVGPLLTFTLVGIVVVALILTLPVGDAAKGQLLGLLGLLVTGAIALSSTNILGNAMAGIMIRAIRHYRPGDYVRIGEHVGRVSDLGILHTEIQTEDRDLTTLPNLYLVSNPLTVLHSTGTVVSAHVSIGYDVPHLDVEAQLLEAAKQAGLHDPFVQVTELGDFSISYRAAGFLSDVKHLLTTRSNLRKAMLDCLHGAGIEIMSPTFMVQRQVTDELEVLPKAPKSNGNGNGNGPVQIAPEDLIFDKADAAEAVDKMKAELETQRALAAELEKKLDDAKFEAEKAELSAELERVQARIDGLVEHIDGTTAAVNGETTNSNSTS